MLFFRHGARNHGTKVVIHSGISIFATAAYEIFRVVDCWFINSMPRSRRISLNAALGTWHWWTVTPSSKDPESSKPVPSTKRNGAAGQRDRLEAILPCLRYFV